mmetsp:Transcript_70365/g.228738  ORF Transcript_70365/g.228738 Transcript_70365/m.228738 type:complete len:460 (-) Transcript_70365:118-1497(-)
MRRVALRRVVAPRCRRHFGERYRSASSVVAASSLVRGEQEAEEAAEKVASQLLEGLDGKPASFALWFAKGYGGARAEPIGPLLRARLGGDSGAEGAAVVVGSASEGGIIGAGDEAQEERFALSAMAVHAPSIRAHPFHSSTIGLLPELGRGGNWRALARGRTAPCVLAFCTLPLAAGGGDPQGWATLLDRALARNDSEGAYAGGRLPAVVGGLPVGNHVFVDGESHAGGCFGLALDGGEEGVYLDAVVSQGSVPFGPWLKITGVGGNHVITELDGQNPREVLLPLINGPDVPGDGHTMAGVFVDPTPVTSLPGTEASRASLALAAMGGRPNCLVRPMHHFTPEGHLVVSPLPEELPYAIGMQLQLHCHSSAHALNELRSRAEHDAAMHGGRPPDAAVVIACGARGSSLHGEEGVESKALRSAWGRDVPTVGFFAGGELGPVGLKTYLHGYTTSCLVIRG